MRAARPYLLSILQAARHGLEGLDDLGLGGGGVVQRLQTDALQQLQEVGDQLHPQGLEPTASKHKNMSTQNRKERKIEKKKEREGEREISVL